MKPTKISVRSIILITAITLIGLYGLFCAEAASTNMLLIKGGKFQMGSPTSEVERERDETRRSVNVSDFYIAAHEVSQAEYTALIKTNPSDHKGSDLPVENVTWYDAVRYCNALSAKDGLTPTYAIKGEDVTWNHTANGYRLPTEAEWEYAARAGTTTPFSTGGNITTAQANYYGTYPYNNAPSGEYRGRTVSVGSFKPNPWGLYNVHGNVWEWCWDWYGGYDGKSLGDPAGPTSGTYRIYRGGGWNDFGRNLRSAYRAAMPPTNGSYNLGFRLARNAK